IRTRGRQSSRLHGPGTDRRGRASEDDPYQPEKSAHGRVSLEGAVTWTSQLPNEETPVKQSLAPKRRSRRRGRRFHQIAARRSSRNSDRIREGSRLGGLISRVRK